MGDKATAKPDHASAPASRRRPGAGSCLRSRRRATAATRDRLSGAAQSDRRRRRQRDARGRSRRPNWSAAFATAQAEAEANFKDGRLYIEKLIVRPRHIEVQVLGDTLGDVVHLGERDCSVQKPSHQKLIEEAPAPQLSDRPCASACTRSRSRGPRGEATRTPGRSSFSSTGDDVYFMEMNTRIQVEHPVTEMVYGVDLVKEQIPHRSRRAARLHAADLRPHGHAIECRDQRRGPATTSRRRPGRCRRSSCRAAPGVRVDTHVYAGSTIPPYYDSLLGQDRRRTAARASRRSRAWNARCAETRIERREDDGRDLPRDHARRAFRAGGVRRRLASRAARADGASRRWRDDPSRRFARELALQALFSVEVGTGRRTTCSRRRLARASSARRPRVRQGSGLRHARARRADRRADRAAARRLDDRTSADDRPFRACAWAFSNCATGPRRRGRSSSTRRSNWPRSSRPKSRAASSTACSRDASTA